MTAGRVLLCALFATRVVALDLEPFVLGAFVQSATFSIANQLGFFIAQGLDVTFAQIPNSTFGYARLLDGTFDMVIGTIDNAVNLRFNQNASLTVVGQLDGGNDIILAGVPSVTSVEDLRGKPIMVDSASSGYVFLLRKILSLFALPPSDYTFQAHPLTSTKVVGGTSLRFANLAAGSLPDGTPVFGTILTYPFTGMAAHLDTPLPELARASTFVAPFSSSSVTVATSAFDDLSPASPHVRATAALLAANRFLASQDPAQIQCSRAAIASELGIAPDSTLLDAEFMAATAPVTGETAQVDFEVNSVGLWSVVDLRAQQQAFAGAGDRFNFVDALQPGPGQLIDNRMGDAAIDIAGTIPVPSSCA
ncbi:hypothetical protein EXIGLDRAFT_608932 [Exidia glandulosa HHB12029]|uniref:SsuA/THI5-like domain-containing protein n=1 Tax=Exidia glandulosa HHB12029 TaxID=1314781 RepID=A0A165KPP8_EXIGL|nr:hypothetical protein EXIGLDRAFT_608932 [Exidia glandulosa HHB12029]